MPYSPRSLKELLAYYYKEIGKNRYMLLETFISRVCSPFEIFLKEEEVKEVLRDIQRYRIGDIVEIEGRKYLRLNFDPKEIEVKGLPKLQKEIPDVPSIVAERVSEKTGKSLKEVMKEINNIASELKVYNQIAAALCARKYGIELEPPLLQVLWDSLSQVSKKRTSENTSE